MRKTLILGTPLILAVSPFLKEDKLQKISFSHSHEIVIPATFTDTSAKKLL
ncbi:MAG: hypothetical protein ACI8ZO_000534 [Flavobacteriales bacterium]|jgi:hypothetical protein